MRKRLWMRFISKHIEGTILPRWLLIIRAILFPLDTFYWFHFQHGYDPRHDEWHIDGVRYAGAALRTLANARGELYKITRIGECVTLERIDSQPEEKEECQVPDINELLMDALEYLYGLKNEWGWKVDSIPRFMDEYEELEITIKKVEKYLDAKHSESPAQEPEKE